MGVAVPEKVARNLRERKGFDEVEKILRPLLPDGFRDDFRVTRREGDEPPYTLMCSVANSSQAFVITKMGMAHAMYQHLVAKYGDKFVLKYADLKIVVRDTGAVAEAEAHAAALTAGEPPRQHVSKTRTPAQIEHGEAHLAQLREMGFYRSSANHVRRNQLCPQSNGRNS